jgi:hypothetical protein
MPRKMENVCLLKRHVLLLAQQILMVRSVRLLQDAKPDTHHQKVHQILVHFAMLDMLTKIKNASLPKRFVLLLKHQIMMVSNAKILQDVRSATHFILTRQNFVLDVISVM